MPRLTVLVASDSALLGDAITMCFHLQPDISVVGRAAGDHQLLCKVRALRPQVLVLEPWAGGAALTRTVESVRRLEPGPAVLVLSGRGGVVDRRALETAGSHAYLPRDAGWETVLSTVREIAPSSAQDARKSSPPLTPRETEVLRGVATAMTNQQIARSLGITTGTVKRHLHAAFRKLGAVSRLDAVTQALAAGLITSPMVGRSRTEEAMGAVRGRGRTAPLRPKAPLLTS